ncbi:hypothetical protein [Micromonospora sp. LOL_023]|uniref:hypothetical protein n=1 Tax=Micromonospora sp. LOL_023 TaxID=3345418 RepID=UPI003A8A7919
MERIGPWDLSQDMGQASVRVGCGETIEITERGRPIVPIVPMGGGKSVLAKLVAAGRAVARRLVAGSAAAEARGEDGDVATALAAPRDETRALVSRLDPVIIKLHRRGLRSADLVRLAHNYDDVPLASSALVEMKVSKALC